MSATTKKPSNINNFPLDWGDLQVFLQTARGGTLAAAATALGVHASTVQRRVSKLEAELSTRLFDRRQRGYSLTSAGEALMVHALEIEREVHSLSRRVGGQDQSLVGRIRVTTVDDMWVGPIAPLVAEFRSQHPQVSVEVAIHSNFADLARQQADVAIRIGAKPDHPDVVAKEVCEIDVALYGARSYFRQYGRPKALSELSMHSIVMGDTSMSRLIMEKTMEKAADPEKVALRSSSFLARMAAIRDGLGIGYLGCFAGETERRLERLPFGALRSVTSIWIVVHVDMRTNARVRTFADFLQKRLKAKQAAFRLPE